MLKLQMLPASCGDCLWLEYGTLPATHIVIIDGGVLDTAKVLRERIETARRERGTDTLDVELLVVTHIDNDHILGVLELLSTAPPWLHIKDVWFNGRPQLMRIKTPQAGDGRNSKAHRLRPADLMGDANDTPDDAENGAEDLVSALPSAADLLGPQQGDDLSKLLATRRLPWNQHKLWKGEAVVLPENGNLPVVTLDGKLTLTLLGPTLAALYKLCAAWTDVLGGTDEPEEPQIVSPADLLGRRDTWPPAWKDGEQRDPSDANGSSIMLLAEYDGDGAEQEHHALLLAGDGHAPDLAAALMRLCRERNMSSTSFPLAAFKLPHHGSAKNLTRAVLEKVDCSRYLISTDGSGNYHHPDHQAILRVLRYSKRRPEFLFNYLTERTRPWRDSKYDVVGEGFQDYETRFPDNPSEGFILPLA